MADKVRQCICGYFPQTRVDYTGVEPGYLTRCTHCNVVYVNGPSKSLDHSIEMWNSFLRESVKMIVQRAIVVTPEVIPDLKKLICG